MGRSRSTSQEENHIALIISAARVVSLEISSGKFPEIYSNLSGKFPEIYISGKFPEIFTTILLFLLLFLNTVQTFEITVYLFTSSLSIGFYSTSVH